MNDPEDPHHTRQPTIGRGLVIGVLGAGLTVMTIVAITALSHAVTKEDPLGKAVPASLAKHSIKNINDAIEMCANAHEPPGYIGPSGDCRDAAVFTVTDPSVRTALLGSPPQVSPARVFTDGGTAGYTIKASVYVDDETIIFTWRQTDHATFFKTCTMSERRCPSGIW